MLQVEVPGTDLVTTELVVLLRLKALHNAYTLTTANGSL
jgi:hypothetical protein